MDDNISSTTETAKEIEQIISPESPDDLSAESSSEENITSADRLLAIADKIESTANLIHGFTLRIEHHINKLEAVVLKSTNNRDSLRYSCFEQNLNRIRVNTVDSEKMTLISNYFAATMADFEGKSYSECTLKDFQSYFKIMRLFKNNA